MRRAFADAPTSGSLAQNHSSIGSSDTGFIQSGDVLQEGLIVGDVDVQVGAVSAQTDRKTGYMLGIGLANYASIIDPEAIIMTGGISHAGKWLYEPTYESFEGHIFGNLRGKVKLLNSELDDRERDVLGASVLAWSVPEYSLFK